MITQPRFKENLEISFVDGDKLFLVSNGEKFLLEGKPVNEVARLINGEREIEDILVEVAGSLGIAEVMGALNRLEAGGHLVEGSALDDLGETAWWDAHGVTPLEADGKIAQAKVEIVDLSGLDGEGVKSACNLAGLEASLVTESTGDTNSLVIVLAGDHLDEALESTSATIRKAGTPWLLAGLRGQQLLIGPLFVAYQTACWSCMGHCMKSNRQIEQYLKLKEKTTVSWPVTSAATSSTVATATGLLVSEAVNFLAGAPATTLGSVLSFDLDSFSTETHAVIRRPQCPTCGDSELSSAPAKITLTPSPKRFTADGGHRVERPEETYRRLVKHVSPLTGAVTSLVTQTDEDDDVTFGYSAGHNFAMLTDDMHFLRKNLRGQSGGKGRTDIQAKTGAICEAIERYAAVYQGDERSVRGRFVDFENAVNPKDLILFSDNQYENRDEWNKENALSFHLVPERFNPEQEMEWSTAWSLRDETERLVPTSYCYYGHPDLHEHFYSGADSNGSAAGNTIEEAVLQGLLEVVERDAVAIWWYNRLRLPEVDISVYNEPYFDVLREHYNTLGRSLHVLDLTTDLGIPVFAAISHQKNRPTQDIVVAFGAHLDPKMAIMRSLTEANQFLPAVSHAHPDGSTFYWMDSSDALDWWKKATIESESFVLPDAAAPLVNPLRYEGLSSDDLATDVRSCVDLLARAGHEVIVLDQTRPDIELNVAKVMVPGLRHFWRRLGPGRLYDVPVSTGRLEKPLEESQLNPWSVFF